MRLIHLAIASALSMLLCSLPSCTADTDPAAIESLDPQWFNLNEFVEQQASLLAEVDLNKTVVVNGQSETQRVDTPVWVEELAPFAQSDIDRPALWDSYSVDTAIISVDRVWQITYSALDSALFTKRVQVVYFDLSMPLDSAAIVNIDNSFSSYVADTRQRLRYAPQRYEVTSEQRARLLDPRTLRIVGRWDLPR